MKAIRTKRSVVSVLTTALAAIALGATVALPSAPAAAAPSTGGQIALHGAVNVRDLGGFRTYDGATVKSGKAIRADALSGLTDADVAILGARKLSSVVDLRTPGEVQFMGADRLPAGVRLVARPIDDTGLFTKMMQVIQSKDPQRQQEVLGNGGAETIMQGVYASFLSAESRAAFGATVRELAATDGPLLYHCTSGKDRTGFLTYVVLRGRCARAGS
ncbi:tyrosine-protein phosphatase [Nocardia sp. FBN12]|uniref:tyrosine-protein phosphatase n=1 Tax=Nocardia sp. FBN12 TaxID=3419766 RepID=UPI003D01CE87